MLRSTLEVGLLAGITASCCGPVRLYGASAFEAP